jgi:hypothetical protein
MGVGYQVSPLHRVSYLDLSAAHEKPIVRGVNPELDGLADVFGAKTTLAGPMRFRSPTVESVLEWRQRLQTKYAEQLGEELSWNERSAFESSEDVATRGDVCLHYVAAVLDQDGPAGLTRLIRQTNAPRDEIDAAFAEADRRGFGGQFPQLLLGASFWLPFEANLMIEEPNWDGSTHRYGSLFRFFDEMTAVRAAITETDSTVVRFERMVDASEQTLVAA